MEHKRRCKTCGKVYCYTDEDLKNNKQNATMATISAIGGLASLFGGTIFHTAHLSNQTDKYNDKVIDYSKCPYCNSRNIASISDTEYEKIAQGMEDGAANNKRIEISANATPESLLKRTALFLEDGEWEVAKAYADACLDIEPENAYAYICKLMSELNVKKIDDLENYKTPFEDNDNFKKAIRFADESLKEKLYKYIVTIKERNRNNELSLVYAKALKIMNSAKTEAEFISAAEIFAKIETFEDSAEKKKLCYVKADEVKKDENYNDAKAKMESGVVTHIENAIIVFESIIDWKDSKEQIALCKEKIKKIQFETVRVKRRNRKIAIITASAILFLVMFVILLNNVIIPNYKYNMAISMMEKGDFDEAITTLKAMKKHKGSAEQIQMCFEKIIGQQSEEAGQLIREGDYAQALSVLRRSANDKGSIDILKLFKVSYDKMIIHYPATDNVTCYTYDENNNCIKEETEYPDGKTFIHMFYYDKKGNCIKEENGYTNTDNLSVSEYFYDDNGNCVKEIHDGAGENADSITEYFYDKNGKPIRKVTRTKYKTDSTQYNYDSNGNCIEEIYSNGNQRQYKYDEFNNLTEDIFINSDGKKETIKMSYNNCGDIIGKVCTYLNDNASAHEYSYDEYGNVKYEKSSFKDSGSVNEKTYEYEGIRVNIK